MVRSNIGAFFLRRFSRIAPAYYLASVLYFLLEPPAGGFEPVQAAGTYLFVNAWHPALTGETPGAWPVVPGSWSIGVEFTFYALFPVLACTITSVSRGVLAFGRGAEACRGTAAPGGVFRMTGWPAVVAFAVALVCIVLIVLAGSWCAYRLIEMPMVGFGKGLIRRRRVAVT